MGWIDIPVAKRFKTYRLNKHNGYTISRNELSNYFKNLDNLTYLPSIVVITNNPNTIGRKVIDSMDGNGIHVRVEDMRALVKYSATYEQDRFTDSKDTTLPYVHGDCEVLLLRVTSVGITFDPAPPPYSRYMVTNTGYVLIDDYHNFGFNQVLKKIDVNAMKNVSNIRYISRAGYHSARWAFGAVVFYGIGRTGYELNNTAEIEVLVIEV